MNFCSVNFYLFLATTSNSVVSRALARINFLFLNSLLANTFPIHQFGNGFIFVPRYCLSGLILLHFVHLLSLGLISFVFLLSTTDSRHDLKPCLLCSILSNHFNLLFLLSSLAVHLLQGFLALALLAFWAGYPIRCTMFSSIPDLYPLDASNTPLSSDNKTGL